MADGADAKTVRGGSAVAVCDSAMSHDDSAVAHGGRVVAWVV